MKTQRYYFVGSGIASLAGAAYLIRDGQVDGKDILILEESADFGGALDAHGSSATGYYMTGSRMFEQKYGCTFDLMSSIPSASDPSISVTEETNRAEASSPWHNKARLVDRDGHITDFHRLGLSERDRLTLLAFTAKRESELESLRISDCFGPHFFKTNFWFEWCTLFAFQPWHSAIELKRYLLRFVHHFATIDTQDGIYRTLYNQYESLAVPLAAWLRAAGVNFQYETTVTDLRFRMGMHERSVTSIECIASGRPISIPVHDRDRVFVTLGSMTANKAFGSTDRAPVLEHAAKSGAWRLWETLAADRPEFGNPSAFDAHVNESIWESFTVTVHDPRFLEFMQKFSGSAPGRGGLITFKDSSWLITLSIFHQPYFPQQPADVGVWWGYGLFSNKPGDYVKKSMAECTGREILEEVLGHLHVGDEEQAAILAGSTVIPCLMPYITSQFLVRKHADRPNVVPDGATNFAFLGQFVELPDDVVFTVEYSIRSAQTAVYSSLHLDKKPIPIYRGVADPRVLFEALEALHR